MNAPVESKASRRRIYWWAGLLAVVAVGTFVFRQPLRRAVLLQALLRADAPSQSAFRNLANRAPIPYAFLLRFWNTQRIPQRLLVADYLKDQAATDPQLYSKAASLLRTATIDVDSSVRELALGALAERNDPALPELAAAMLHDADPQMRLLGLQYLRQQNPHKWLPAIIGMLHDSSPMVVATAASILRRWTGHDFGIRMSMVHPNPNGETNSAADSAELQNCILGWQAWWKTHHGDYEARAVHVSLPLPTPQPLPMADFALQDLSGKTLRYSDFKGKIVLLNFWTTWCPSCLEEIPDLIQLQKKYANELVILGISLDGQTPVDQDTDNGQKPDLADIRAKVSKFAKDKGINYLILLDPTDKVGCRFNGEGLPTNVLIDKTGYIRRRFIGARNLPVWEAMIKEVGSGTTPTPAEAVLPAK